jgi:N-methylhydantoinase A
LGKALLRVGVDIGGTFTDVFVYDEKSGQIRVGKTPTTPPGLVDGVISALLKTGTDLSQAERYIGHGSTVFDNAVIERRIPRVALVTTNGFRDLLEVGRWWRSELYDLQWDKPAQVRPLIRRGDIFVVNERIGFDGRVISPLNTEEARRVAAEIKARGFVSVAIFFINSYANPEHELMMAKVIDQEVPGIHITTSTGLIQTIRELPRLYTAVFNACVIPAVNAYLTSLTEELRNRGFRGELLVFQSNGGTMRAALAARKPVLTAVSGVAAGVVAARELAENIGINDVISFDMGGTTVKACLISGGELPVTNEFQFEWDMPIGVPMIDMVELGAGGGSIAWLDEGKMLRVGPRSAGSVPGPACYQRGGTEPTVTDANLVLGRLNPSGLLGGELKLDLESARHVIAEKVAGPLGLAVEEAAMGIIRIANTKMTQACRTVSVGRGFDSRDFHMVAFGGAGPMHCAEVAADLQVKGIIVPPDPGVFSALGMCTADFYHDFVQTFVGDTRQVDMNKLNGAVEKLETLASEELDMDQAKAQERRILRFLKMKYLGEPVAKGLEVPIASGQIDSKKITTARKGFDALHNVRYGFSVPDEPVWLVELRVRGVKKIERVKFRKWKSRGRSSAKAVGQREVYFEQRGYLKALVYAREKLDPGNIVVGPAIIEELTSTCVVPPKFAAKVDRLRNLVIWKR